MKRTLIITLLSSSLMSAYSQSNYIKTGSIGEVNTTKSIKKDHLLVYGPVAYRDLEETIGETYIILPLRKDMAVIGYYTINKGTVPNPDEHLSAEAGAGLLLKLVSLEDNVAHFKDDKGVDYVSSYNGSEILYMAPVSDIENAKKLLTNKTLWYNKIAIQTYNDKTGEEGSINDLRFEPLTVTEVVAGSLNSSPVRLIVKTTKGQVGYVDEDVSGTNTKTPGSFLDDFFTTDPKITYKYTPVMWNKIKNGEVEVGMTEDQVRLSIGPPGKVNIITAQNITHKQLIYGYGTASPIFYHFTNNKLTSIQN